MLAEDGGDKEGEEDGQEGGEGHHQDTHWTEQEVHDRGLAVEEAPLNNDSNDSEGEREEDTGEDCEASVPDSDLLTEKGEPDGHQPFKLQQDQGKQVVDLYKQTKGWVEAKFIRGGILATASLKDDLKYQVSKEDNHKEKIVSLKYMARPQVHCFYMTNNLEMKSFIKAIKFRRQGTLWIVGLSTL